MHHSCKRLHIMLYSTFIFILVVAAAAAAAVMLMVCVLLCVSVCCPRQHHHSIRNNHCRPWGFCYGEDQHQTEQPPSGIFSPEKDWAAAQSLQDHLWLHVCQQSRSEPLKHLTSDTKVKQEVNTPYLTRRHVCCFVLVIHECIKRTGCIHQISFSGFLRCLSFWPIVSMSPSLAERLTSCRLPTHMNNAKIIQLFCFYWTKWFKLW